MRNFKDKRRVPEAGLVGRHLAGDHGRDAANESPWLQCLRRIGLAAVKGKHLPARIPMRQLRHDRRLAGSRVSGNQQRSFLSALAPPAVEFAEEPPASAEIAAFEVQKRREVPRLQPAVPTAITSASAAHVLDRVQDALESSLVLLVRFPPAAQVDVIEAEDAERRLARPFHHRHDRLRRPSETSVADLVQADAVASARILDVRNRAHGVGAEDRNQDVGVAQARDDRLFPAASRHDLAAILPHDKPALFQVLLETLGQIGGIGAAVAEKHVAGREVGMRGGRWRRHVGSSRGGVSSAIRASSS
jgi:hypothetical protein